MNTYDQRNLIKGSEKKLCRFLALFSRKKVTSFWRSSWNRCGSIVLTVHGKMIESNLRRLSWSRSSCGMLTWSMNILVFWRYFSCDQCWYRVYFLPLSKVYLMQVLNLLKIGLYRVANLMDSFILLSVLLVTAAEMGNCFELTASRQDTLEALHSSFTSYSYFSRVNAQSLGFRLFVSDFAVKVLS